MVVNKSSILRTYWVYGCIAGLFLAVFAAYPQIKLMRATGTAWQGHYAFNDIDEVAYASYLKALIDGRPRKNDPYTGRDESPATPQPESLFSIQFAAPYAIAIPARIFGLSAATAMTLAGIFAGFFTALLCFVLVREFSGSSLLGFAGSLFVLCGGALFAGEGAIGELLGTGFPYPYFPFLRRYVPAIPFPVFFLLLLAVWRFLIADDKTKRIVWWFTGVICFSFLVFSYFYIWTTAAAWLFVLMVSILLTRPETWRRQIAYLVSFGVACLVPLAVYGYMLSQRAPAMDHVQLLVRSRAFDLDRIPLFLGGIVFLAAVVLAAAKVVNSKSPQFIFTLVTGAVPFVLFNQQVITGVSLQPIHYQVFIGNYVAGLSIVFLAAMLIREKGVSELLWFKSAAGLIAGLSIIWGFVECHYTVRVLDEANLARDRALPVGKLLVEKGKLSEDPFRETIFSVTNLHADDTPTVAPQNVLWARHQHVFAGLNWQESKERFYKQLYFSDRDHQWLDRQLRSGNFVATIALFGWGRHTNRLSAQAMPLTNVEVEQEVQKYRSFYDSFGRKNSVEPQLDYFVAPLDSNVEFKNLNKWYKKTLVQETGGHRVFKLDPK